MASLGAMLGAREVAAGTSDDAPAAALEGLAKIHFRRCSHARADDRHHLDSAAKRRSRQRHASGIAGDRVPRGRPDGPIVPIAKVIRVAGDDEPSDTAVR
jgi:hypothetical protein